MSVQDAVESAKSAARKAVNDARRVQGQNGVFDAFLKESMENLNEL
jgi:hypothetical protein